MMRPNTAKWFSAMWKSGWVTHSARTAVAAAVSFAVALALSALWPEREPASGAPLPGTPSGPAPKAP